jgi:DUF4097 and DUF4098 domain-containing protein YvlB
MKTKLLMLIALIFTGTFVSATNYEKHTETIRKTLKFSSQSDRNLLILKNVQGFVKVEGYSGAEVQIEAEKTISAKSQSKLEQCIEEFELIFEEAGDRIFVYLKSPFILVKKYYYNIDYDIHNDNQDYQYKVNFTVKVPHKTSLKVSTINEGGVEITEVRGNTIEAANINGDLALKNIAGTTKASTINGNVTATYRENPSSASSFKTINGNITATFLENLSAEISMKTLNGEYYTNFTDVKRTAAKIEKNTGTSGKSTVYKVDKSTGISIGDGKVAMDFETLNGDIYLKKAE